MVRMVAADKRSTFLWREEADHVGFRSSNPYTGHITPGSICSR
jgi:hypothetical protein